MFNIELEVSSDSFFSKDEIFKAPSKIGKDFEVTAAEREKYRGKREFVEFEISSVILPSPFQMENLNKSKREIYAGTSCIEKVKAVLHFYKHDYSSEQNATSELPKDRSCFVCINCVPVSHDIVDLLQFLAPILSSISNMRIVQAKVDDYYLVLLQFSHQESADDFYTAYNNVPFNSMESSLCHVLFVEKIETVSSSETSLRPPYGVTELPSCAVCLERLDEKASSIFTTLCNHSFHCSCLSRWKPRSCPVCRHSQQLASDNECAACECKDGLWMCLICGYIGCGRYLDRHSYQHFLDTHHTYAMELETQRVWDYVSDNYVHRLIQSSDEGKLVEVSSANGIIEDKVDSLILEYTYLLTSQLESQRRYYFEQQQIRDKEAQENNERIEKKFKLLEKDHRKMATQLKIAQEKHQKCKEEYQNEKQISEFLKQNQLHWQKKAQEIEEMKNKEVLEKENEANELHEQIRDLMFYLESQDKMKDNPDVQGGQLVIVPSPKKPTPSSSNKSTPHSTTISSSSPSCGHKSHKRRGKR